jgi:phosphoglycerate kinase
MAKLTIDQIELKGKVVLIRVDFNVPLDDQQNVRDDFRIRAAIPTIEKVMNDGGKAVLCSHLGRPKGQRVEKMSLRPVAVRLGQLMGTHVKFAEDCIGPETEKLKSTLQDGDILLLENLRFHPEEEKK